MHCNFYFLLLSIFSHVHLIFLFPFFSIILILSLSHLPSLLFFPPPSLPPSSPPFSLFSVFLSAKGHAVGRRAIAESGAIIPLSKVVRHAFFSSFFFVVVALFSPSPAIIYLPLSSLSHSLSLSLPPTLHFFPPFASSACSLTTWW